MVVTINPEFNPVPSLASDTKVSVASSPKTTGVLVKLVAKDAECLSDQLRTAGFEGKKGQSILIPGEQLKILLGIGDGLKSLDQLRDAVAVAIRVAKKESEFSIVLEPALASDLCVAGIGRVAVEGTLLARYAYEAVKSEQKNVALTEITLVADDSKHAELTEGAERGKLMVRSAAIARDLGNTPPRHLTAVKYADVVAELAPKFGLEATVYDHDAITELGLGGILGVNAGSVVPPRVVKLEYKPANANGHVALVGKGITYDSGGISLKPSNPAHCAMKMDMMGSGAVFAAMTALRDLGIETQVTGFLMLTDNMPSGSATKLGDVLTMRNSKTVEVLNTDAEGRLVLGDGLALAAELEPRPDALIDVATLTGAALVALGEGTAAVLGNNDDLIAHLDVAGKATDEQLWELPLDFRYRKLLDSKIADLKNIGGPYAGTITAALFLNEFVSDIPWAHLDIAGPMESQSDELWRSAGSTGFGSRLLVEYLRNFSKPAGDIKKQDD